MGLIDTKTGDPWPSDMANMKLQEIRETCREDLRKRDESRGIVDGKLTDTITLEGAGEGDAGTKDVINAVKQQDAHTGDDFQRLLLSRWAKYCAEPRDLQAFVATLRTPQKMDLEAVTSAAADVEASLPNTASVGESDSPPGPLKRGPGRPKREATVGATITE